MDAEHENEERFKTTAMAEFSDKNFRRLADDEEREKFEKKDQKEYDEYFKYFGFDLTELYTQETEKRAIDLLPTSGYRGFKSRYRTNIYKKPGSNNPLNNFNVGPLTAKLKNQIYQDVSELPGYQTLPQGFQKTMQQTTELNDKPPVKLPTVGYTGHRPGYNAQNFYAKSFRECALHSKWIQNNAK